jgi:hypothetical protein
VNNIKQQKTKTVLPLFFVDLAPETISKEIFNITAPLNTKIKVEEPHKRREIPHVLNVRPTATQGATILILLTVLNEVGLILPQIALNHLTCWQNAPSAMANIPQATKVVLYTKSFNSVAVNIQECRF